MATRPPHPPVTGLAGRLHSFGWAIRGLRLAWSGANFRWQVGIAGVVALTGAYAGLTDVEWAVVGLAMGLVLAAECFNSAIEQLVDLVCPQRDPRAARIKELAAGGVLLAAFTALLIGLTVLGPNVCACFE